MDLKMFPSDFLYRSASSKMCPGERWGYLYDLIFSSLLYFNKGPIRVLELGVSLFGEGSGHAFSEMSCIEKYVGVDFVPLVRPLPNGHVFIQENTDTRECVEKVSAYAPFDLMIHDASHNADTQIFFLKEYRHLLKKPGVLLVENVTDPKSVLEEANDPLLHLIEVPPGGTWMCKGLLKVNF